MEATGDRKIEKTNCMRNHRVDDRNGRNGRDKYSKMKQGTKEKHGENNILSGRSDSCGERG